MIVERSVLRVIVSDRGDLRIRAEIGAFWQNCCGALL